jgi:hydroxymethylbilane synthase
MKTSLRIGTRGSALAIYQTELVKTRIENNFNLIQIEVVRIKTSGDMVRRGGTEPNAIAKRFYTKEIEDALLAHEIDVAVHSAKDLSVMLPQGLKIGAVLEREDPRDCLISKDHVKLSELPLGARVGTSSLRRKMQLLRRNPELIVEEVHGNVDSRIRKIEEGEYDALVLAHAGIMRLGLTNYVTEVFPQDSFYPSPGQGNIIVQSRINDSETDEILEPLHHKLSGIRLACERAFLAKLEGGCQLPCGITSSLDDNILKVAGALFAIEDHEWVEDKLEGPADYPEDVGETLADLLLRNGGKEILEKIRGKH